jgi:hypothetical protein
MFKLLQSSPARRGTQYDQRRSMSSQLAIFRGSGLDTVARLKPLSEPLDKISSLAGIEVTVDGILINAYS